MSEEYRIYPLADHIRCSRDGRIESCLRRGCVANQRGAWTPLVIQMEGKRGRYPYVSIKRPGGQRRGSTHIAVTVHNKF